MYFAGAQDVMAQMLAGMSGMPGMQSMMSAMGGMGGMPAFNPAGAADEPEGDDEGEQCLLQGMQ